MARKFRKCQWVLKSKPKDQQKQHGILAVWRMELNWGDDDEVFLASESLKMGNQNASTLRRRVEMEEEKNNTNNSENYWCMASAKCKKQYHKHKPWTFIRSVLALF